MRASRRQRFTWSILSLSGTRALLSGPRYRILVGATGLGYALLAMVVGGMIYFPAHALRTGWFFYVYPSGPGPSWSYPAILAGGPTVFVDLPLLSGILMTLTAAGIGLGMSLGVLLGARLIRDRRAHAVGVATAGSIAGFGPALIGLVTLGACCSTAAAATAGIALVAQASGTSPSAALANAWYLGLFQVVVVYVALVGQEQLLRVYGFLTEGAATGIDSPFRAAPAPLSIAWNDVGRAALRIALLLAGVTWSVALFADWFSTSPLTASPATWTCWLLEHQLTGILAIAAALFPGSVLRFFRESSRRGGAVLLRASLVISGATLATWTPTLWLGASTAALGNELMGFLNLPVGWGAVTPPDLGLFGLLVRWTFQFALLGGYAILTGASPEKALLPLVGGAEARASPREPLAGFDSVSPPTSS